jgi:hypothetical protein
MHQANRLHTVSGKFNSVSIGPRSLKVFPAARRYRLPEDVLSANAWSKSTSTAAAASARSRGCRYQRLDM